MLISYDTTWDLPFADAQITIEGQKSTISTASACLAKPAFPNLDDDLRYVVMKCTAEKLEDRPNLDWLFATIQQNIKVKIWTWYKDNTRIPFADYEQDHVIQNLIHGFIFYPGNYHWVRR